MSEAISDLSGRITILTDQLNRLATQFADANNRFANKGLLQEDLDNIRITVRQELTDNAFLEVIVTSLMVPLTTQLGQWLMSDAPNVFGLGLSATGLVTSTATSLAGSLGPPLVEQAVKMFQDAKFTEKLDQIKASVDVLTNMPPHVDYSPRLDALTDGMHSIFAVIDRLKQSIDYGSDLMLVSPGSGGSTPDTTTEEAGYTTAPGYTPPQTVVTVAPTVDTSNDKEKFITIGPYLTSNSRQILNGIPMGIPFYSFGVIDGKATKKRLYRIVAFNPKAQNNKRKVNVDARQNRRITRLERRKS
jgi:hypothetical protein